MSSWIAPSIRLDAQTYISKIRLSTICHFYSEKNIEFFIGGTDVNFKHVILFRGLDVKIWLENIPSLVRDLGQYLHIELFSQHVTFMSFLG